MASSSSPSVPQVCFGCKDPNCGGPLSVRLASHMDDSFVVGYCSPGCLKCATCGKKLNAYNYYLPSGKIQCYADQWPTVKESPEKVCKGCGETIGVRRPYMCGFHVTCGKCEACGVSVSYDAHIRLNSPPRVLCPVHYKRANMPKIICPVCEKEVEENAKFVIEKRVYHSQCVKCSECNKDLSGEISNKGYHIEYNKFQCLDDYERLRHCQIHHKPLDTTGCRDCSREQSKVPCRTCWDCLEEAFPNQKVKVRAYCNCGSRVMMHCGNQFLRCTSAVGLPYGGQCSRDCFNIPLE